MSLASNATLPEDGSRNGPLAGLQVIGLEHSVAGPLCTRILADLGATVTKIERSPDGDFARHWDTNVRGESAQFWWLNRGKQGIALDLKSDRDKELFFLLLEKADVLVQNLSPSAAERLGLTSTAIEALNPRLVHCQITGYGADGPYRRRKAYDMLVQAEAGVMSVTGTPDRPTRAGISVSDVSTGIYAASLVLAAVIEQRATGIGRSLDVAMFDVTTEFVAPMLLSYLNGGVQYPRFPDKHHAIAPYGVFQCGDGEPVLLAVEQNSEWIVLCERLLLRPEFATDERYATNASRLVHRDSVDELVAAAIRARRKAEILTLFEDCGLAYATLNDMSGLSNHPVMRDRGIIEESVNINGDPVQALVGLGERVFGLPPTNRARPPALGEDAVAVRHAVGLTRGEGYNG